MLHPGVFHPNLFLPDVRARTKAQLFGNLVDALCQHGVAQHREAVLNSLLERERLGTTALGNEIAVPHTKSMMITSTTVLFARLAHGLDFGAADAAPIRLVFLLTAPYGTSGSLFLPLLAGICRMAHDVDARRGLLSATTFRDLEQVVQRFEIPTVVEPLT
jgi:mannitol/fructose-specific phosphotransferase system IIA component (Ntr-type)